MVTFAMEYKCICCGIEIDETEYSDPRDADVCGYCFADKWNEVQSRKTAWPSASNECGRSRETCFIAEAEIQRDHARKEGNDQAVIAYERMLRAFEA